MSDPKKNGQQPETWKPHDATAEVPARTLESFTSSWGLNPLSEGEGSIRGHNGQPVTGAAAIAAQSSAPGADNTPTQGDMHIPPPPPPPRSPASPPSSPPPKPRFNWNAQSVSLAVIAFISAIGIFSRIVNRGTGMTERDTRGPSAQVPAAAPRRVVPRVVVPAEKKPEPKSTLPSVITHTPAPGPSKPASKMAASKPGKKPTSTAKKSSDRKTTVVSKQKKTPKATDRSPASVSKKKKSKR